MNIGIIVLLIILVVVVCYIVYQDTSEQYIHDNKTHFDDRLEIRRRMERVYGPKRTENITPDNIDILKSKYGSFFYVLIDSGNIGSKINAYHYAQSLGVPCVKKYYIGNIKDLQVPNHLQSFVIKPANLSSGRGVLIVINNDVLGENGNFTGHSLHHEYIIKHYRSKYSDKFPQDTTYVVEEFIPGKNDDRPLQCNFFSFNGQTPFIFFRKFDRLRRSETVYIYSPNKKLLYSSNEETGFHHSFPPGTLSTMAHADRITKSLGTFMRIDFLINQKTGEFKMVETSTFPFCAHQKHFSSEIDELTRQLWSQCFPFNDSDYPVILQESLKFTAIEPCKTGYKK